jgi:hypothetical protein
MRRSSALGRLVRSVWRTRAGVCFRLRYGFWPGEALSLLGVEDLSRVSRTRRRRHVRGLCAWLGHPAGRVLGVATLFDDLPVQVREFASGGELKARLHLTGEAVQRLSNLHRGAGTVTGVEVLDGVAVVSFETALASGQVREGQGRRPFASPEGVAAAVLLATESAQRVSLYRALGIRLSVRMDPLPRDEEVERRRPRLDRHRGRILGALRRVRLPELPFRRNSRLATR